MKRLAVGILVVGSWVAWAAVAEPPEVDEETVRILISEASMTLDDSQRHAAFEAAIPTAERFVEVNPGRRSWQLLILAQLSTHRFEAARAVAEKFTRQLPDHWLGYLYLGQALTGAEDHEAATDAFERSMELAKHEVNRADAGNHLAHVLKRLGRFDEAIAIYEEIGYTYSANEARHSPEIPTEPLAPLPGPIVDYSAGPSLKIKEMEKEAEELLKELEALEAAEAADNGG